jgi:hypothetical protein
MPVPVDRQTDGRPNGTLDGQDVLILRLHKEDGAFAHGQDEKLSNLLPLSGPRHGGGTGTVAGIFDESQKVQVKEPGAGRSSVSSSTK